MFSSKITTTCFTGVAVSPPFEGAAHAGATPPTVARAAAPARAPQRATRPRRRPPSDPAVPPIPCLHMFRDSRLRLILCRGQDSPMESMEAAE
ncbi:hypothetical protein GCM10009680_83380 [Streptomyces yatensis]|uniref:Uncharacterized protein n=1 Tax=Streptomyces yatensis TaxID=155177 RepID=A0ABN2JJP4_9ACTN